MRSLCSCVSQHASSYVGIGKEENKMKINLAKQLNNVKKKEKSNDEKFFFTSEVIKFFVRVYY